MKAEQDINLAQVLRLGGHGMPGSAVKAALQKIRASCSVQGDCWIWEPSVNSSGYPQARIDGSLKMVRHHVLCELLQVELLPGWWVSSRCRSKRCCSPACLVGMLRSTVMERSYAAGVRAGPAQNHDRLSPIVVSDVVACARPYGRAIAHPHASVFSWAASQ